MSVKKRFKDEKAQLETANKRQSIQVEDLSNKLQDADTRFVAYKQSVEHSPLNVLRNELSQKQIEIVDQESKMAQAKEQRDEYKLKFERVKKDMIALKKQIDHEKEMALTRQAGELEQIKKQMKQQAQQQNERQELDALRHQLTSLSGKLKDTQMQEARAQDMQQSGADQSQGSRALNPFQTTKNKYLDNYASSI